MPEPELKVVYIVGWGRSGTTVLDNMLGELEGFVSTGEICFFWERGIVAGRRCGCGERVWDCELWSEVLKKEFQGSEAVDAGEVARWRKEALRVRHTRTVLRELPGSPSHPELASYVDVLGRLYRGVAAVTGAKVIVDSSKRPSDGAAVRLVKGITPYFVHMVRDPRAVAYSWSRPKALKDHDRRTLMLQHGAAASSLSWVGWNLAAEAIRRREPGHFLRIRYEDFVGSPRKAIDDIAAMLGEHATGLEFVDDHTVSLGGNHTVSGNPSRFSSGPVRLRRDDEWIGKQRPRDRLVSTALALPLLRRYGYPIRMRQS
jgi:hypothetical protein